MTVLASTLRPAGQAPARLAARNGSLIGLSIDGLALDWEDAAGSRPIIAPLTHRFEGGILTTITGAPGSGQTALLAMLALTLRPTRGMIRYDGMVLTALTAGAADAWRRARLAMIPRHGLTVTTMTVREHLALACATRRFPMLDEAGLVLLDQLDLLDKADVSATALTRGERQRLAVAQALCFGPSVVLADRPTADLDDTDALMIADCLRANARATGAVIITTSHDSRLIDCSDAVVHLPPPGGYA